MNDPDIDATLSRRRLLTTTGAGLAGLAAAPGLASAQEQNGSNDSENGSDDGSLRIQTRGVMPETGRVTADKDYTGFLVHLTARLDSLDVGDISECSFVNWNPDDTDIFETQLVDRVGQEQETIASTVYVPNGTDLRPGDLLVINSQRECSNAYIGVQMENIRAPNRKRGYVAADSGQTGAEGDGGSSGAFGPGFGPLAAVGGLAGGAYALARRGDGE
ncbi:hypothetical protein [Halomarina litorea]|uniref:hypothetical protein n=1 Tax=Halomarina litorea TaxID=2961595 RepID=UPI0020C52DB5|nr:hypothetical protein [Halomarina sp. BCD28]